MVGKLMDWRKIKHVPIENDRGELVGLITSSDLVRYYGGENHVTNEAKPIKEIMSKNLITVGIRIRYKKDDPIDARKSS